MEKHRREVGGVGPSDRVQLRIETQLTELGDVSQRLEDFAVKFMLQIDLALRAVVETELHDKITNILRFAHLQNHDSVQGRNWKETWNANSR